MVVNCDKALAFFEIYLFCSRFQPHFIISIRSIISRTTWIAIGQNGSRSWSKWNEVNGENERQYKLATITVCPQRQDVLLCLIEMRSPLSKDLVCIGVNI
ncbi:hypothetical protein KIN20_032276 [Parelaphostrongylus tenuis]|uniref:Uncharacterized protein n=1 Tax=Parelaphostrongylus tenuis TaxID=148309 RepID=A0AAD5R6P2_PARTN|nr:hypothetical protein KIN20_032276 [Parelaphostrongylus tenuis]